MTEPYDRDNIFAKIIRGEIPAIKVVENDDLLAMMDIFPQSRGHVLVIPKAASRNLLDAAPETVAAVTGHLPRLARAVREAMDADGIKLVQYSEAPAGQTVFHLHFHLIPVYDGIELGRHLGDRADETELNAYARQIAARLDRARLSDC